MAKLWDEHSEFNTPGFDGISAPPTEKPFGISAPAVDNYPSMLPETVALLPAQETTIEETDRLDAAAENELRSLIWAELGQHQPATLMDGFQIIITTTNRWAKQKGITIPDRSEWLVQSDALTAAWRIIAWMPIEHLPGARQPQWTDAIDAVLSIR